MADRTCSGDDDEMRAWAAGLFEGEGSVVPVKGGVRLQLKMTDEDVVRRFCAIVGGTVYGPYSYDDIRKPAWAWTSDGADPQRIAEGFWPWLGVRRRARIEQLRLMHQMRLFPE